MSNMMLNELEQSVLKTYVGIVLDESGSMGGARSEIISGITEQIQSLQNGTTENMETYVLFVTFSDGVRISELVNVKDFNFAVLDGYAPSGMTAMVDAVGDTINELKILTEQEDEANTSYLLVIASDGEENASKRFKFETVAEMIQSAKDTKRWTITYMGANQDLSVITEKLKIDAGNVAMFSTANAAGYSKGIMRASSATGSYMASRGVRGPAGPNGAPGAIMTSMDSFYSTDTEQD